MKTTIILFDKDLRVSDHAPLLAASQGPVVPLFVWEGAQKAWPLGGASKWWLHNALQDLDKSLTQRGAPLILRRGNRRDVLLALIGETKAAKVAWHRRYAPGEAEADRILAEALRQNGIEVEIHDGFLLYEPNAIFTGSGKPFRVFTPFSKACFGAVSQPSKPVASPKALKGIAGLKSEPLEALKLVPPKAVWPKALSDAWMVSEKGAQQRLSSFLKEGLSDYGQMRDRPDVDGTSKLSPYLHYGQISVRQVWYAVLAARDAAKKGHESILRFQLEILWREFSWHLLQQFPHLPEKPLQAAFEKFPWREDFKSLQAWQKGQTGYPIVDAGMRQLWQTGWMHNRVRMIVASFLIKHLLIHWKEGEAWFWDTLVDADLGANAASWQWVAGCGADAAPYFRIFNPVLQGEKFDPDGAYIRHYVPELARLDTKYIHAPWNAPSSVLSAAGITLGKSYPAPMIDHNFARKRALAALAESKGTGAGDLFGER